jgi:preprotein translocase subunit SecB
MTKKKRRTAPPRSTPKKKPAKQRILQKDLPNYLRVSNVRLLGIESGLQIEGGKPPEKLNIDGKMQVGPNVDGTSINVNAILLLEGLPKDEAGESASSRLSIKAVYQCVFHVRGAEIDTFSEHSEHLAAVGYNILLPYMRELVHSITSRMGYPVVLALDIFAGLTEAESSAK